LSLHLKLLNVVTDLQSNGTEDPPTAKAMPGKCTAHVIHTFNLRRPQQSV